VIRWKAHLALVDYRALEKNFDELVQWAGICMTQNKKKNKVLKFKFKMTFFYYVITMTDALTTRYAKSVPIDIISTSVFMSDNKASRAPINAKKYIAYKGICVWSFTLAIQAKINPSSAIA